jgi:hypothetical protein
MAGARELRRTLERATTHAVRKLVLDIEADLREQTPVDTGWAAANWIPSLDIPVTSPVGSRDSVDVSAQQRGIATIATAPDLFRVIYITNNVPYIEALNNGHSPQAPAGYVEDILNRRVDEFNRRQIT